MAQRLINIAGQKRGWLTAILYDQRRRRWLCRCDCGVEKYTTGSHFRRSVSCGCQRGVLTAAKNFKHGDAARGKQAAEYGAWCGMIKRCCNPKDDSWDYYGGRGIAVCDRWRFGTTQKTGYQCFLEDMGRKPSPEHSLDRENNDGNYDPRNCRWATKEIQMSNRRARRTVVFRNRTFPVAVAARLTGLPLKLILDRLDCGWSDERALSTPKLPLFGGTGVERFSHSDAAKELLSFRQESQNG